MLLFKYLSPDGATKVLEREASLALRFGLPKTYNDPYELFLQPYPPLDSDEQRAFYDFFLGEVVEAPVSCFSRRPNSVVMWAHYAREGTGLCLGFDEDVLADQFPIAFTHDVTYSDRPATVDSEVVNFAFVTGKRRHTLRLLELAHRSAYFIKRSDWQYEAERRLVVSTDAIMERDGHLIADVTPQTLRFIILGVKVLPELRELAQKRSALYEVPLLEFEVGKRTYEPFFVSGLESFEWSGDGFLSLPTACTACGEPTQHPIDDLCEWCAISDETRELAPKRSMLVATLQYGIDKGLPLAFDGLTPKGRLTKKSGESE